MENDKNCSNCYYVKSEKGTDDSSYCLVKKDYITNLSCCGYYLKNVETKVRSA